MADKNDSDELESAERSTIATVKTKRAVLKRRITNALKKLHGMIEQYGRKSFIRGYVNILEESLNEAQVLNNQLLAMLPEQEHENALNWYEEELERVQEAKLEAEAHLEERKEESYSALSSLKLSKFSRRRNSRQNGVGRNKGKTARNGRRTTKERVCKTAGDKTQDRTST